MTETATLGGGCFWCLEAVYDEMKGVLAVESGYMGGHVEDPTYQAVCAGRTGHIEVVRVTFDPAVATYREILEVFFDIHDPTSRDRQGNDVGQQYRSVIFIHSDAQKAIADEMIRELGPAVVTEVRPAETFYQAEDYHQDYFRKNPNQGYCAYVVAPKVKKFRTHFTEKLKSVT
ncbi:MAG TPA: peptide-methionine (S)-S-oxide reductase MsrA [Candidatus Sulfopaludibacter sp.]|nr:peptide-methionine (S)-S-oxide reductase MsrA [Candidatus Sulfopaludibacter sp.]